jgi:hypothetical protein
MPPEGRLHPLAAEGLSADGAWPPSARRLRADANERPGGSPVAERLSRTDAERWGCSQAAKGRSSAFGGTRPNNSRSISIRFSASRSGDCPAGVLLSVGSTPSSAGWTPPRWGWTPVVDDRPPSRGALIPSGNGRPPLSGSRAPSLPGRCHFCGSEAARGRSTEDGPAQRPRIAGLKFATGVPLPNRALTAASR